MKNVKCGLSLFEKSLFCVMIRRYMTNRFRIFLIGVLLFAFALPIFSQNSILPRPDALRSYRTGRDLESQSRMDEALIHYDEAVRICLNEINQNALNMDSYTVLTWTLQRQGKYRDVLTWGERGLQINANDYRIIETMGEASFYLDDYDQSLRYMQRYIDAIPEGDRVSVAYFFMGEIYRLRNQYFRADIAYTAAVRLEPNSALWWYRLGITRENLGDYTPAMEAFQRAINLNPNYREAADALSRVRTRIS
jgi:tetratricopeptide (TPR) repeat protein